MVRAGTMSWRELSVSIDLGQRTGPAERNFATQGCSLPSRGGQSASTATTRPPGDFQIREFSTGQAVTVLSITDRRSGSAGELRKRGTARWSPNKVSAVVPGPDRDRHADLVRQKAAKQVFYRQRFATVAGGEGDRLAAR